MTLQLYILVVGPAISVDVPAPVAKSANAFLIEAADRAASGVRRIIVVPRDNIHIFKWVL